MNKKKLYNTVRICSIILIAISILTVILLAARNHHTKSTQPTAKDINTINGCPEFYELHWGTSFEDVDLIVESPHTTDTFGEEDIIRTVTPCKFNAQEEAIVYCGFNHAQLTEVVFVFSAKQVTLDELRDMITKLYGPASDGNDIWEGQTTIITVESADNADGELLIRYKRTAENLYTAFIYNNAPEHSRDPFEIIGSRTLLGCGIAPVLTNLLKDVDYSVSESYSYTNYTFFPVFEYMGFPAGSTAIELRVSNITNRIDLITYIMFFSNDDAPHTRQIRKIIDECSIEYGTVDLYTTYQTTETGSSTVEVTEEEFFQAIAVNVGQHSLTWLGSAHTVTLDISLSNDSTYSYAALSFTKR